MTFVNEFGGEETSRLRRRIYILCRYILACRGIFQQDNSKGQLLLFDEG